MTSPNLWYGIFIIIFLCYLFVMLKVKDKKKYFVYFLTGCFVGFYFDFISVSQGYYAYYQYFPSIYGVPLTVTIAEGFSVSITIYLFNKIRSLINKFQ